MPSRRIYETDDPALPRRGENGERALLLKELNHRSKNIMQSAAAMLELAARRTAEDAARLPLRAAAARLRGMAEAYGILYRIGSGEPAPARTYLEMLCAGLARTPMAEEMALRIAVEGENPLWPDDVVSYLGMMVSEAVNNSIRHGFKNRRDGAVTVRLERDGAGWLLRVADDGEGFETAPDDGGLGRDLIAAFARYLSGTVETRSRPGAGTEVRVSFREPGAA